MNREPADGSLTERFLEIEGVLDRVARSSTHYQVLGVEKSATSDEINRAHKRTMALLNPSYLGGSRLPVDTSRRIKQTTARVIEAFMVLNNFGSRVEYDNSLVRRAPVPLPFSFEPITPKRPDAVQAPSTSTQDAASNTDSAASTTPTTPETTRRPTNGSSSSHSGGGAAETIIIEHSPGRALFTKPIEEEAEDSNKRRYQRLKLSIPTYVTGYDRQDGRWTEVGHTVDVSIGGVSLQLAREMREGSVVHLTLPMPTKLRRHGYSDPAYKVYAIVRRVEIGDLDNDRQVIGLEFLGASPPPGYLQKPWAIFHTQW